MVMVVEGQLATPMLRVKKVHVRNPDEVVVEAFVKVQDVPLPEVTVMLIGCPLLIISIHGHCNSTVAVHTPA